MLVILSEQGPQGTEEEVYLGQRWGFSVVQFTVHNDQAVVLAPTDACAQGITSSREKGVHFSWHPTPSACRACSGTMCGGTLGHLNSQGAARMYRRTEAACSPTHVLFTSLYVPAVLALHWASSSCRLPVW